VAGLLGTLMAFKEKSLGQGGWYAGKIIAVRVDADTILKTRDFDDIVYPDDDEMDGAENNDNDDEGDGKEPDDNEAEGEPENEEEEEEDDDEEEEADDDDHGGADEGRNHAKFTTCELAEMVPEGSVVVHYRASQNWDVIALRFPMYSSVATARIRSWMLLEERPLGIPPTATARDPNKVMRKGRPRMRRHANAMGPMSRKKNKKGQQ